MGFHSVADFLAKVGAETAIDDLSPEQFSEQISEQLPVLSCEFSHITLRLSANNVPRFVADLRHGQAERAAEIAKKAGHDPHLIMAGIDPNAFDLPRRIETYAAIHPFIEIQLSAEEARLLAEDLARGISSRRASTSQETDEC